MSTFQKTIVLGMSLLFRATYIDRHYGFFFVVFAFLSGFFFDSSDALLSGVW